MADYFPLPSLIANEVITASYLNVLNDNSQVISTHDHSGGSGEGASIIQSSSAASPFAYRHEVYVALYASQINWATLTGVPGTYIFGEQLIKTTAVAASLSFPISLYRGAHKLYVMFDDTIAGSTAVLVGGSTIATIVNRESSTRNEVCSINFNSPSTASYVFEFNTDAGTNWRLAAFNIAYAASL